MLIEDDDASEAEMAESSENVDAITQTILLITRLLTEADQPMAIVNQAPQAMQYERRQTRPQISAETKTVNRANKSSNARIRYGHTQSAPEVGQAYGASVTETNICQICQGNYKVQNRQEFTSLNLAARVDLVKQKKLCFKSLRLSHMINQCPGKSVCRNCRGKHHSLIHRERLSNERAHVAITQSSEVVNSNQSAIVSNETAQSNLGINGNSQVILATALVSKEKPGSHEQIQCRAFLDPGAQLSCITEQCVQTLGLAKERSSMQIFGIGASGSTLSKYKVSFNLLGDDRVIPVEAFVLDKVTGELPSAPFDPKALKRSRRLKLADPKFYQPSPIDILIGNDVYERLMMAGKIEETEEYILSRISLWMGRHREVRQFIRSSR